ncbi:MAG: UDP-N-acetylmuramoyl-L-alanyl-D-glutamate--2,6-diaminopimelate ligase [Candidatus Kapabacteria bacterium]|nr:UDP-N-acetylmuramoyl-L-alanyl-D-glutamate--2,6-diaminopimelate ligase [Candidatus Kapabacteria bacterium]
MSRLQICVESQFDDVPIRRILVAITPYPMKHFPSLLALLPDAEVHGNAEIDIIDVTNDSRLVKPGWVFVAIAGTNVDSHDHVAAAVAAGAVLIVGQRPYTAVASELGAVPYVCVGDSRYAFAVLTHAVLDHPTRGLRVFGVTGTNGKTTCATLLEQIFAAAGHNVGFIGTTGIRYGRTVLPSDYTTPHARALCDVIMTMKQAGVDTICMEVSSHALDQHRVEGIRFQGAVFTNLTRDHLDYHGTMERYADAKKKLFDMLDEDAVAVVFADDAMAEHMVRDCRAGMIVRVGSAETADVVVNSVSLAATETAFTMTFADAPLGVRVTTPLVGQFNVTNASLCAVMAMHNGVSQTKMVDVLRHVRGPAGRMERYELANGAIAVIDYAHTPDALAQALKALRDVVGSARLHVVFGCGGDRDAGKRPQMGRIAGDLADVVWLTSDNPRSEDPHAIIDAIRAGIRHESCCIEQHVDRAEAIREALADARPGDIVLIAGKGHETYQVVGSERYHFSDAEQVARFHAAAEGASVNHHGNHR